MFSPAGAAALASLASFPQVYGGNSGAVLKQQIDQCVGQKSTFSYQNQFPGSAKPSMVNYTLNNTGVEIRDLGPDF